MPASLHKRASSTYRSAMLVSWMLTVGGTSAVIFAVTVFSVTLIEVFMSLVGAPESLSQFVPWIAAVFPLTIGLFWVLPTLGRFSGLPLRQTVPYRARRLWRMRSLSEHQMTLRITLLALALLPFLTSLLRLLGIFQFIPWTNHTSEPLLAMTLAAAFFALGIFFFFWIANAYQQSRASKIRRSLRFYHRGVALRSYIAPWDNPQRPIYTTCRISRRLANLHRASVFTIASCFSAAGCLAARSGGPGLVGEAFALICILAMIPLWPVPSRIVHFSATVIDPFCRDPEEYEIYE